MKIRAKKMHLLVFLMFSCLYKTWVYAVPAFPGAEGGGAISVGGRGGRIIEVTNLKGRGSGSLRAACEAAGPRIVVFRVSGIIHVSKPITIRYPCITIAGQTAQGGGILVKGHDIAIETHDVIIRFIRIRTGRQKYFAYQEGDCIAVRDNSYNVIVDHCSFSWSNDKNIEIWSAWNPAHNITFSWNLMAEALKYGHGSSGFLVGSNENSIGIRNISIHHNLFMSCANRFPLVKCHDAQIINNLIYNWSWWPTGIAGGIKVDIIGNKYVMGPSTAKIRKHEVMVRIDWKGPAYGPKGTPSIYIKGNIGPRQSDPYGDNWNMLTENILWNSLGHPPDREKSERLLPITGSTYPVTVYPVSEIEELLINDVGANRRLNNEGHWVSNRDEVDKRLISEYLNRKGTIPVDEKEVGGYPAIATGIAYADSDHDGMSDTWENKHGLNSLDGLDSSQDLDGDGYSNIEEFLNGTNPGK
jgi:pectate lyase